MNFISLAAFLTLTAGSPVPAAKADSACCNATKAKAPAKIAKAGGYICPITGDVLPCPSCCPANTAAKEVGPLRRKAGR
jgi:hypothetical protein